MNDKRRNTRFIFEAEVEVESEDGVILKGDLVNMSTGGVMVMSEPLLSFGDKVILHILLPGVPDNCAIPCIVRWLKPGEGAGLQFESLRPIEMWAVNRLKRELADS